MIQSKFNKFLLKNNESLELSTEKDDKITELSSDTFKSAINKSKEYGNDRRTYKLGSLFYNTFIGKPFLGGIITNIGVNNPSQGNYTDISIEFKVENKVQYLYYDVKLDSWGTIKDIKMSRKDANLLSLISLKVNPESKYKQVGKEFNIDYDNVSTKQQTEPKIKPEPEPKKYNDFETVFTVGHVYNHNKYGNGEIVKDIEGLCKSGEVLFKPFDNSKLGLNLYDKDKALWNDDDKDSFDIVNIKDLSLTESINNNLNPNVKYQKFNLLDRYKANGSDIEYEEKFNIFKNKVKGFTDSNDILNLKTGDIVSFISGYNDDIIYTSKILGFDNDGHAFILWECYWYAVDLSKKMVAESVIVNESSTINILKNKFKEKYFDEKTKTWKEDVTRTLVIDFLSKNKINLSETDKLLNVLNESIKDKILTGAMCVMLASGLVSCSKVDNPSVDRITYKPEILNKLHKNAFNNLNAESNRKNNYIWYTNVYGTKDNNDKDIERRHAMYDYTSKEISYGTKNYNEYPGDSVNGASTGITPCEVVDIEYTQNTSYKLNPDDIKKYKYLILIKVHNSTDIDFSNNNNPKEFAVDEFTGYIVYLTNINKINTGDLYPTYPQNLMKDTNKLKKLEESPNFINIKP